MRTLKFETILKCPDYQGVRSLNFPKFVWDLEIVSCLSRCPFFREFAFRGSTIHGMCVCGGVLMHVAYMHQFYAELIITHNAKVFIRLGHVDPLLA